MELAHGGINFELSLTMQFVQMRADAEVKAAHSNSVGIEHIFLGLLKLAELKADDLFNAPDFIIKTMSEDISKIRGMFAAAQIDTSRTRALLRYMAGSSTTSDEESLEKCCIIAMNNAKDRHSTAIWAQDMLSAIMDKPTDMILQVCPVQREGKIVFAEEKPIENTSADEMSKEFLPDLTNRIRRMRAQLLSIPIVYETFAEPDPGRIGFFSDGIRPIWVMRGNQKVQVLYPAGTAVIENYLQRPSEIGKKRFTIAHEGAHFVIAKHIPAQTNAAFHSEFDGEMTYTQDMLHEMMSINEAFTNRAAACFLMPLFLVLRVLKKYNGGNKIVAYDGYVMAQDQKIIVQKLADATGVNYSPLFTRLKELNLIDLHPIDEYLTSFNRGGVMPS